MILTPTILFTVYIGNLNSAIDIQKLAAKSARVHKNNYIDQASNN